MAIMNARKHYFRDENDNRTVVSTDQLETGFKAWVTEGEHADVDVRGYGHSRLAAIADLNEKIQQELNR